MQTFETARLLMRPLQLEDEAFYCACYTDPVLMQHNGEPLSDEAALRSFLVALKTTAATPVGRYTWVMQAKASGFAVGLLAMFCDQAKPDPINAELGTIMLTKFQNQGFTVEALSELADVAFNTTQLKTLLVKHNSENIAVARVMGKLGYLNHNIEPSVAEKCVWALNRGQWQIRNKAKN